MPESAPNPHSDVVRLVTEIHATEGKACIVVTGAGTQAIAWLFAESGASRTMLEASVPYSSAALFEFTGERTEQHVSAAEAMLMAEKTLERAKVLSALADGPRGLSIAQLTGVACTAAIATDRARRGEDRCHVAFASSDGRRGVTSLVMNKGARDRSGEEEITSRIVLNVLAAAKGVAMRVDLPLEDGEELIAAAPGLR
jgi:hypothetical protein